MIGFFSDVVADLQTNLQGAQALAATPAASSPPSWVSGPIADLSAANALADGAPPTGSTWGPSAMIAAVRAAAGGGAPSQPPVAPSWASAIGLAVNRANQINNAPAFLTRSDLGFSAPAAPAGLTAASVTGAGIKPMTALLLAGAVAAAGWWFFGRKKGAG